jgi:hypothetical protein
MRAPAGAPIRATHAAARPSSTHHVAPQDITQRATGAIGAIDAIGARDQLTVASPCAALRGADACEPRPLLTQIKRPHAPA